MTAISNTTLSRPALRLGCAAAVVALLASTVPQWAPELAQVLPGLSSSPATPASDRLTAPRIAPAFEANRGQFDPEVAFVARAPGHNLFLTPTQAVVSLRGAPGTKSKPAVVRLRPVGGRAVPASELVGGRRRPGTFNYLIGDDPAKWQRNVARYGAVTYPSVYPGIDLVYHSGAKGLEYDYVVAPGADPSVIAVEVDGATGLRVERGGALVANTAAGPLRQAKPVVYQQKGSNREAVRGAWVLDRSGHARFRLGSYDATRELVIDPVLVYSSYLGGSGVPFSGEGEDRVAAVAVDEKGHSYLTGFTTSQDFPTKAPGDDLAPYQEDMAHENFNAFVAKMGDDGTALEWATFLGSAMEPNRLLPTDAGKGIAIDPATGAPSVVILTNSSKFPVLNGRSFATTCGCTSSDNQAMVAAAKLSADGSDLLWSTYVGPAAPTGDAYFTDYVRSWRAGLALDSHGSAYITSTAGTNFPTTDGSTCSGCTDAGFVVKLDPDGTEKFGTYLTGAGAGIAVAPDGSRVYLAGARDGDAYVTALDPGATSPVWERSVGTSSGPDRATAVALGPDGRVFVAGATTSADLATPGALSTDCGGGGTSACDDAFVAELDPLGGASVWAAYLGGSGSDEAAALAVEPTSGALWVVGTTASGDFPLVNPIQDSLLGQRAAFAARVASDGSALVESTYMGGTRLGTALSEHQFQTQAPKTEAAGVAVDPAGAAYVVGYTNTADYPVLSAFQESTAQGNADGFVTKLATARADLPLVVGATPRRGRTSGGTAVTIRGERLGGARELQFGPARVPCPSPACEVRSAEEIRAVTPAGARGEALVRVTTRAGTSPPNPLARFTYTAGSWDAVPGTTAVHRVRPVAVLLENGKVLVAGGCGGKPTGDSFIRGRDCDWEGEGLASAQLFDPLTGTWRDATPMNFARQRGQVSHENGCNGPCVYGPSAVLLTGPRCGSDCGKVLVAGGARGKVIAQAPSQRVDSLREPVAPELYTPDPDGSGDGTDSWEKLALSKDVDMTSALMLEDGRVLFIGGPLTNVDDLDPTTDERPRNEYRPWLYDPADRSWAEAAPEGYWRGDGAFARLPSGKVFATGGLNLPNNRVSSDRLGNDCFASSNVCQAPSQVFDPSPVGSPGSWSPAGSVPGNEFASATLLAGPPEGCGANCGKVLVTGGSPDVATRSMVVADADLFDPEVPGDAAWVATKPMVGPTRLHQSVLLPDGTVLVVGGNAMHDRSTSSLFDPRVAEWLEAGDLLAPRTDQKPENSLQAPSHMAVVLSSHPTRFEADPAVCGANCGKVLVMGGNDTDANGDPIGPISELYTPSPTVRSLVPPAAPAGATVTVKGTGFTNVAAGAVPKVSFGGVEASEVKVVSFDTLTATVPPMADSRVVDVTVTNQGGRSDTGPASRFTYTGIPGMVRNVVAVATSESAATVSFDAAGIIGEAEPPATDYDIRFSRSPIADIAAFDAARALAHPPFVPGSVGQRLSLDVGGLRSGTTYYFAIRAVGQGGNVGPLSDQASTKTFGTAPIEDMTEDAVACAGLPAPGPGQVAYPGSRYSLVGGPDGTVIGAGSPLYSWFDLGARGDYSVSPGDAALQAGRGYWAWSACPKLVDLATGQDSVSFGLGAYRASMVANPSGTSPATATGHDFAARWDPEANGGVGAYEMSDYRAPQRLALGEGAWAFSYAPTQIHIRASG